ncbi:MAG: chromosome segregation protein [Actinomycetota bacterium]
MFLKTLTLKGFKSFADVTNLEFEPGITVVVGPNGSGKSNVVDAVAWVLGAQGPRTVRSSKMEDVIFAGSGKRAALGRAEVSLTIDNSSGLLPIAFSEVKITRTLFRSSGESEYSINDVPCRLLDVQELLSDTGVGRQQHVIVSQGQLDAVLNARPEDRRLIIEEAAGVLKYRRRREKAQRRLDSTEGNLLRLQDLVREVRRQLKPLERQADAARRHGSLVEELAGIRLYLAGKEIATHTAHLEKSARARVDLKQSEEELRGALARLDADVLTAEAITGPMDDDLGDALMRYEGVRERGKGLAAVLVERRRSAERELTAALDQGVVASLEGEAARLSADLEAVEAEAGHLAPQADEVAAAEAALATERAAVEEQVGDGAVLAGGQAAELRGELAALRAAVERDRSERARLGSRLDALAQKTARLDEDGGRLRAEVADAMQAEADLTAAVDRASSTRAEAETAAFGLHAALQAARQEQRSWDARAEALALALDQSRARAGAESLAGLDGVVGTLLDLVEVDEGWEAAVEAAAGEAVAAVVVDGVDAARRALIRLREDGASGAVLALDAGGVPASLDLESASVGGEPVRAHVRARLPSVDHLLDRLLATAVAVDRWEDALDLALAHPGLVAVTRAGDRFAAGGWRTGTGVAGATGASLEEARRRVDEATATVAGLEMQTAEADEVMATAKAAEAAAARELDANDGRLSAGTDALARLEAERRDATTEAEALRRPMEDAGDRLARDEARVAELTAALPALEAEESAGAERAASVRAARARVEERTTAVATLRTDLEVRAAGLEQRRSLLTQRLTEVNRRLELHTEERADAGERRRRLEAVLIAIDRLAGAVAARLTEADAALGRLRAERDRQTAEHRAAASRLDGLRRERATAERQLTEVRERAQRNEIDEAESRLRLETAVETLRRDFDREPEAAVDAICPELPPGTTAPNRVRELERELRLMGAVNPLALEEFTALQERHTFLEAQLEDVRNTRRELGRVIKAIDTEIVEVFSAAYTDVADNFVKLFATLFPGGTGRLRLTDPDHMLETGIEVEARPSGKNVRKLSLLSGGERSLTALAFLFAVFRSRPSPFYLMDEVEAALDDVNLHRVLVLIQEFRNEAQLVIVSHQKRTMEAADLLYGVTMPPGGSSRIVSQRIAADN